MDATRGAAMFAVILSHSSQFLRSTHGLISVGVVLLGMVATPTFLMLSGALCGHLLTRSERSPGGSRWRLLDRGLFLLLVAHVTLAVTHIVTGVPYALAMWGSFYITDAVGVGLLVAAILGTSVSVSRGLAAGAALVALSWLGTFVMGFSPDSHRNLFRLLIGLQDPGDLDEGWIVPIIPYLGVFLLGFAGGKWFSQARSRDLPIREIAAPCIRVGSLLILSAVALKGTWMMVRHHISGDLAQIWFELTDPRQKVPPGAAYELLFGGAGLILFGCISRLSEVSSLRPAIGGIALIGRTSLLAYVAQYWLISVPALRFGMQGGVWVWLIGLTATIGGVLLVCRYWDGINGNRLFTVGLSRVSSPEAQVRSFS